MKGSTVGRKNLDTAEKIALTETVDIRISHIDLTGRDLVRMSEKKAVGKILKDMDFLELERGGISVEGQGGQDREAGERRIRGLIGSITQDVRYLQDNKIMDYSLLVTKVDLGKMDGGLVERC